MPGRPLRERQLGFFSAFLSRLIVDPHQFVEHHTEQGHRRTVPSFRSAIFVGGALLLLIAGYIAYAFMDTMGGRKNTEQASTTPPRIVQLDVLNGCGVKGAGAKLTSFLRTQGFDVVEMKNYKSFKIHETLVIDRIGDLCEFAMDRFLMHKPSRAVKPATGDKEVP